MKHKLTPTQVEIIRHGIRWANNILTELSGNYAKFLSESTASQLRVAISALYEAEREISLEP